jgi:hypothetical protein
MAAHRAVLPDHGIDPLDPGRNLARDRTTGNCMCHSGWHADIRIRLPIFSRVMANAVLDRFWTVQEAFRGTGHDHLLCTTSGVCRGHRFCGTVAHR